MKLALLLLGCFVLLIVVIVLAGALLPRDHVATRSIVLPQPADTLFRTIRDFAAAPSWRSGVSRVEILPPTDGHAMYRETSRHGTIAYKVEVDHPSGQLVTRIADDQLPFGGTWTFELTPESGRTRLRITENGYVTNPVFRFMARFVFGYTSTMDTYLRDLARHFGQTVEPSP